jgi:zinc transport system substrate-binding protein
MNQKNKKKNMLVLLITLVLMNVSMLSGCVETEDNGQAISIIVTIIPQKEIVSSIGGEHVDITVMVPAGQSPHTYEPTPEQLMKVSQADAYFIVGSGVEFELTHLDTIKEQNSDLIIFDCSEEITVVSFDEHYGHDHHHDNNHDEEHHDNDHHHGGTDPHIWTSPVNFKKIAETVYNGLVEIDLDYQETYFQNYQNYISQLDSLHKHISDMLEPYEGRSFMVYHPAWGYFGDTYKLKQIAIEDGGKQPGPAGISAIIQQAQNESIRVIFVSPQFDTSSAETIAEQIDGKVAFANPLMTDYIDTLNSLAESLVGGYS